MREEHRTGFYLKMMNGILDKHFNSRLKEFDLTRSQFEVLKFLQEKKETPVIQRDIETFFHISNPSVTGILNRLQDKELIARNPSDKDRRTHHIILTEKGNALLKRLRPTKRGLDSIIERHLSPEEARLLNLLLKKVFLAMLEEEEAQC